MQTCDGAARCGEWPSRSVHRGWPIPVAAFIYAAANSSGKVLPYSTTVVNSSGHVTPNSGSNSNSPYSDRGPSLSSLEWRELSWAWPNAIGTRQVSSALLVEYYIRYVPYYHLLAHPCAASCDEMGCRRYLVGTLPHVSTPRSSMLQRQIIAPSTSTRVCLPMLHRLLRLTARQHVRTLFLLCNS